MLKLKREDKSATEPADPRELTDAEREELRAAEADAELKKRLLDRAVAEAPKDRLGRHDRYDPTIARMHTDHLLARDRLRATKNRVRHAWERRQIPPELRED